MGFTIKGKYTSAFVTIDEIDEGTMAQITAMVNHPSCTNPIAIMPDTHLGKGCVIGFTMELGNKVVPNFVGVDCGCGMLCSVTSCNTDFIAEDWQKLEFDKQVRSVVPMGFNICEDKADCYVTGEFYKDVNERLRLFHMEYTNRYGAPQTALKYIEDMYDFTKYIEKFGGNSVRIIYGLGSLGGGNHFIEVSQSDMMPTKLCITIHTGSRNFGKQVCEYHQNKAWDIVQFKKCEAKEHYIATLKESMANGDITGKQMGELIKEYDAENQVQGISKSDAFLEGEDMYEYLYDMVVAQTYASWNRKMINRKIMGLFEGTAVTVNTIESVHNFIDFKDFFIRKGAIRSYVDEQMIIPFNSRDGILICEGKSNKLFNYSAPHGAGRLMARGEANRTLADEDVKAAMEGVFATQTPKDESPLCYKPAAFIEEAIAPTATIIDRLKPIINFKAE